jgi:hypothetical protein
MPDTASYANVVIDRQQRAPALCTPERLQAADVLRLAGFVYLVPPGDSIYRPAPEGLEGLTEANRRNLFAGRPVYVGLYFHFLLRLMCVVVLNARLDLRDCLVDKLQRRLPVAALVVHS